MTDTEARYAQAAASMWREKIETLAKAHHVPVRQEAIACLWAVITLLKDDGAYAMSRLTSLIADVISKVFTSAPPDVERTAS